MFVDLNPISRAAGESLDVKSYVDLSCSGDLSVSVKDVFVSGKFVNDNGVIRLTADISYDASFVCARCLEPFDEHKVLSVSGAPVEDDFVDGFMNFNLSEWVGSEVWSSLPIRFLCSDDCAGLCAECGNLTTECICTAY